MSPRPDHRRRGKPAGGANDMRPPGPLEVCQQIAAEHAANTIATLKTQRTVRLADRLDDYGRQLSALAEPEGAGPGEAAIPDEHDATAAPTSRARRLAELIDSYGVDPDHNQTNPADRYAAVLVAMIDREAPAAGSFDTVAHACEWLASGPLNTNPREPACVVDLETGQHYTPEVHVTVTLVREEQQ